MSISATALAWQSRLSLSIAVALVVAVMVAPPLELAAQKPPPVPPEGERLDPTFGTGGRVTTPIAGANGFIRALALQPDGKIVGAGLYSKDPGSNVMLLRYLSDGSLDPTFGVSGMVVTDIANGSSDDAMAMVLQPDRKIVIGGVFNRSGTFDGDIDFLIARYHHDGTLDASFGGGDGVFTLDLGYLSEGIMGLALQPDGKIVAAGFVNPDYDADAHFALMRLLPNGTLDPAFGTGGIVITDFTPPGAEKYAIDIATALQLQPDGKIVVAGKSSIGPRVPIGFALARYATDGSLDPTFGVGGKAVYRTEKAYLHLYAIALQANGQIVASGVHVADWTNSWIIRRYEPNGLPDTGFGMDGEVVLPYVGHAKAIAVEPEKGILVAGNASLRSPVSDFGLGRLRPDGTVDTTFGHGSLPLLTDFAGSYETAAAIVIQPDGRIVLGGSASIGGGRSAPALARYIPPPPAH